MILDIFATCIVVLAWSYWLRIDMRPNLHWIRLFAVATVLFRSELAALAGPLLIMEVFIRRRVAFWAVFNCGLQTALLTLSKSIRKRML